MMSASATSQLSLRRHCSWSGVAFVPTLQSRRIKFNQPNQPCPRGISETLKLYLIDILAHYPLLRKNKDSR